MNQFDQLDAQHQAHLRYVGAPNRNEPSAKPMDEKPTPLIHETPVGDRFPVDALGPLKDAALAIQDKTQAPVAIGAQSLLSATSLAAQALSDVRTLGGVRPLSLFALTIAKSGERKSSCDALRIR